MSTTPVSETFMGAAVRSATDMPSTLLQPAFADPVLDAQRSFRAALGRSGVGQSRVVPCVAGYRHAAVAGADIRHPGDSHQPDLPLWLPDRQRPAERALRLARRQPAARSQRFRSGQRPLPRSVLNAAGSIAESARRSPAGLAGTWHRKQEPRQPASAGSVLGRARVAQ